jgi:GNAT superfamily N-acetyltransferase
MPGGAMLIDLWISRNPRPTLTGEILLKAVKACPDLYDGFDHTKISLELYLGSLKPNKSWAEELVTWHRQFTNWIPQEILTWWLPWFDQEPNLEPMPLVWWQHRALALVAARIKGKIVAVAALTVVIGDGTQGTGAFQGNQICYEIRGAVIAPAYRGLRIFSYLVEELLAEARMLGRYPTFLATRNPGLRKALLERESTRPINPSMAALNETLCWHRPAYDSCTECPMLPGNAMWWRTDMPLSPGESRDRFSQDKQKAVRWA